MITIKNMMKFVLISLIASCILYSCKKVQPLRNTQSDDDNELIVGPSDGNVHQDTLVPVTAKKVVFKLGEFSTTIPNFKDSAEKSLGILSEIFSSQEFKDSVQKYTFICANGSKASCIGNNPGLHRIKCDAGIGMIKGQTVYEDLVADTLKSINIRIQTSNSDEPSMGFTNVCSSRITSNDYWLKNDNKTLSLTQEYAVHLAHEFTHTVGYIHGDHARKDDIAYRIGAIVRNILTRRANILLLAMHESLAPILGTKGFNEMRIRVSDLPGLSPDFMRAYKASSDLYAANNQNIAYIFLTFLPDDKVRFNLRGNNSSGTYFVIWYEYDMEINDDGVAKLTYTGNKNAIAANDVRTESIRDYLTSHTFAIEFMRMPAPAHAIVGGFTSVDNPDSFFYGVMLD